MIELDPSSPWGYELKHATLHKAGNYDNVLLAFEGISSSHLIQRFVVSFILVTIIKAIRLRRPAERCKRYKTASRIRAVEDERQAVVRPSLCPLV